MKFTAGMALVLAMLITGCATAPSGRYSSLDAAIADISEDMAANSNRNIKAAVLNVASPSKKLSEYIIDELIINLVGGNRMTVVDRQETEALMEERKFQLSGEVSDESAQSIGRALGAQAIITGSITETSGGHRLRMKMLRVETRSIEAASSVNIARNDTQMRYFLNIERKAARSRKWDDFKYGAKSFFEENWVWMAGLAFGAGMNVYGGMLMEDNPPGSGAYTSGMALLSVGTSIGFPMTLSGIIASASDKYYDPGDFFENGRNWLWMAGSAILIGGTVPGSIIMANSDVYMVAGGTVFLSLGSLIGLPLLFTSATFYVF